MVLTVGFMDGFDHYPTTTAAGTELGILQVWQQQGAGGLPSVSVSNVGYKGRGQRLELGKALTTDGRLIRTAPTGDNKISCHIASSITKFDVTASRGWVTFRDSVNAEIFSIRTLPAGALGLYNNASLLASTGPISEQVPHRFNIAADITSPSNCHVQLWVDGDKDTRGFDYTGDATNSVGPFRILGLEQWGYGAGADGGNDHGFDDVVYCIGDNVNIGELELITQGPTSDVQQQWTRSTGANNYANVDEIPPNGDTDYNSSSVIGNTDLQGFPALPTTPDSIFCLTQVFGIKKEEAGTRTFAGVMKGVGADVVGVNQNVSTSYDWFYQHYLKNPDTLAAWLTAERAAAAFGYKDVA